MPVTSDEIAAHLASGYPSDDPPAVAAEFAQILKVALPALAEKAEAARLRGGGSAEEVWKAIRVDAEGSFRAALSGIARVKVLYVASKFMNNRAIGTMITQAALAGAAGGEV